MNPSLSRLQRDATRLVVPDRSLGVPIPAYSGRSLPNVARSVFDATVTSSSRRLDGLLPPLDPSLDPFAGRRAPGPVILFLVDGLGWWPFLRWTRSSEEWGDSWRGWARPITTVFPTTTTAALTSASTAVAPALHGLVGYRQFLPRFGVVADLLRMSPTNISGSELLVHRGFRPSAVSGAPTLFRRGMVTAAVSRDRFQHSGFTRVLYDGARFRGYATATDLAHQLTRVLEREEAPTVYVYWDELDTIQHLQGTDIQGLFDLELTHVAALIEHVARHLPPRLRRTSTLLLTGDHGQVASARERQLRVDRMSRVVPELAHPLSGDRRAGFFAARSGRRTQLESALRDALPRGTRLLTMEEATASGLFGPPPFHPELAQRLGDFLALVPVPYGLTYLPPGARPPARHLFGAHGGLAPQELVVPLIAGPLDALATPLPHLRLQQR